ncbi:MAG: glycosyltransferase, partial [Soonwooa sp.]
NNFLSNNPELITKIRLLGKVDDLQRILKLSDVFLLPSEQESFGLAALEAMAAGVPVISSNAGGIPEVNIHGKTGFVANIGDVERMTKYAIELLSDEKLLADMKLNAKENAELFDIKNIIPQYIALYNKLLKK